MCAVSMLQRVHEEYEKILPEWKAKFDVAFKMFEIGAALPRERFNSEGRHPTGGKGSVDVLIVAFKAHQHRLYGVVIENDGKKTFVGMELVTDKKKNKADQSLLKRIAKKYGDFL